MKNESIYDQLSKIVNSAFGTTGPGSSFRTGQKVNLFMRSDAVMEAKYMSLVTFTTNKNLDSLMTKYRNEGYALIETAIKKVIEEFEEKNEGQKLTITINSDTSSENVEYLNNNSFNSLSRAFYRLNCLAKVESKNGKVSDKTKDE